MKFEPTTRPDIGFDLHTRTWGYLGGRYSFVICLLDEESFYTASWMDTSVSPTHSVRIEGKYKTLQQAESACRRVLKELNNKN